MRYKLCVAVVNNDSKVDIPIAAKILGCERVPPVGTAKPGEIQSYSMLVWYLMEDS